MKKRISIVTLVTLVVMTVSLCLLTACYTPNSGKGFDDAKLTWSDDFKGDTLDRTKWNVRLANEVQPGKDYGIRRAGYYTEDAIKVEDGNLVITTDYRQADGDRPEGWYTGWVDTSSTQTWQYGYFEIKAKYDYVPGAWFAFWMMPDRNEQAKLLKEYRPSDKRGWFGAEFDIMEGNQNENKNINVYHYSYMMGEFVGEDDIKYNFSNELRTARSKMYTVNKTSDWHTYGLEWTEDEIVFFTDGKPTWKITEKSKDSQGNVMGISKIAEYILLTGEIGGIYENGEVRPGVDENGNIWWSGDIRLQDKTKKYNYTIDYVQVWDKRPTTDRQSSVWNAQHINKGENYENEKTIYST